MKYPAVLLAIAAAMLLAGLGIHMHATGKYMDKMYYHTIDSGLYKFSDVFAERKMADTVQRLSLIAGVSGGIWFVVAAMKKGRDQE